MGYTRGLASWTRSRRTASALGQLLHPSEVKSSTTATPFPFSGVGSAASELLHALGRSHTEARRRMGQRMAGLTQADPSGFAQVVAHPMLVHEACAPPISLVWWSRPCLPESYLRTSAVMSRRNLRSSPRATHRSTTTATS